MLTIASKIFEDIRDQPYRVCEASDDNAPNCLTKGKALIERLGTLGYTVRGRIAEFDWLGTPIPKEIIALHDPTIPATHFYVEILEDDLWRALDPSWDAFLATLGFPIATFDGKNSPGLTLTRVYELSEQIAYLNRWNEKSYIQDYFAREEKFLKAINSWLAKMRAL